jgi:hypothetical protein
MSHTHPHVFTNEAHLEKVAATKLVGLGVMSFHNDPGTYPGIPDRYIAGGNWIEFKRAATIQAANRSIDRQRAFINRLVRAGDRVWVCVAVPGLLYLESWEDWNSRIAGGPGAAYTLVTGRGRGLGMTRWSPMVCNDAAIASSAVALWADDLVIPKRYT